MTILLNGGENPNKVFFNGTDLDEVVYNGVTVWDRTMTTDNITISNSSGSVYASIGRLTFLEDRGIVYIGQVKCRDETYEAYGRVSLKISTGQLGKTNTDNFWTLCFDTFKDSDVIGLPNPKWFMEVVVPETAYVPLGCYSYTTVGEQAIIGDRVKTGHFSLYSREVIMTSGTKYVARASCLVKSAFDGDYIVNNDVSDRFKYYGKVTVHLYKPV